MQGVLICLLFASIFNSCGYLYLAWRLIRIERLFKREGIDL